MHARAARVSWSVAAAAIICTLHARFFSLTILSLSILISLKVKVKCFRVPDASARVEPELNLDFPPLSKH